MASGNERTLGAIRPSEPAFGAGRELGIAVGAIDNTGKVTDFSNPAGNRRLDFVTAPGVNIFSTMYEPIGFRKYIHGVGSGTSFAAPYVAGVAALMLSATPNLTPAQVETILATTATP